MSRARLERKLDDLFFSLERLNAKEFKVAEEDKKVMMGSQVYLSRYKENFVELYKVYEQIADTQVKIANLDDCTSEEKESLLEEALQLYKKAIEGLKYIHKTPSFSLIRKYDHFRHFLENARKLVTDKDAMDLQPAQEASETLSATSTPSLARSLEIPAATPAQLIPLLDFPSPPIPLFQRPLPLAPMGPPPFMFFAPTYNILGSKVNFNYVLPTADFQAAPPLDPSLDPSKFLI